MDLLSQYKQQHPEAFREQKQMPMADEYGREYSGMIAFVMRVSGGKIKDIKQAMYILLAVATIIGLLSFVLFAKQLGFFQSSPGKVFYPPPTNTP